MDKHLLMGVDIGTGSVKVAVLNARAETVGESRCEYRLLSPEPGHVQLDSGDMWRAFLNCLHSLFDQGDIDASHVAGIGISCLCPGLTAFDKDGRILVEPILYSDQRSVEEASLFKERIGEQELFDVTANNMMAGAISGTSMLWIKRNLPQTYRDTRYFGHVNTLMAQKMTGATAIDPSNASYTGLFETKGRQCWSEDFCRRMGLDVEKLPPLLRSSEVVGGICNADLIDLGIPPATPVVIGGGDTACASLAAGVVRNGDVCESVGSTNVLSVCVDKPRFDRAFINRCHVVEGTWLYQGALSHTGSSLRWFRQEFCKDLEAEGNVFARIDAMALSSKAGAGGVVFLPYMAGERSPVWDPYARGVFFGLSLHTTREDMARAILESCGYGMRQLCLLAEQSTGRRFDSFVSIGGGAKSAVWAQIKADIMGKDVHILDMRDAAPVGAALLAGTGCGIFQNVETAAAINKKNILMKITGSDANHIVYSRRYRVYTQLYAQLKELFRI